MPNHIDKISKKKRYGQVFSGRLVGDLLVSMLPNNITVNSIIDPMVGKGDLLCSACMKYPQSKYITGIDIDTDVIEICRRNVPKAKIVNENAFVSRSINKENGWDLVITNPPYIRYQTLKSNPKVGLPDSRDIRILLKEHVQNTNNLDYQEKLLYLDLIEHYSGLSDMAIPSWILCASMVKKDGYLAIVVPETWLNREYALPIQYLLLRCFEIEAVSRDLDAFWFDDAEVRTCLVVCKRKNNEPLKLSYKNTVFLDLHSNLRSQNSLIAGMRFGNSFGYEAINQIIYTKTSFSCHDFSSRLIPAMDLFPGFSERLSNQKWVCQEDMKKEKLSTSLPNEMKKVIENYADIEYNSLCDMGWTIGQGLRTGANDFFYAQIISEKGPTSFIQTNSWHGVKICVPSYMIKHTLKKRSDINGVVARYNDLKVGLIYIQNQVKKSDLKKITPQKKDAFSVMNSQLDSYISKGESYVSPIHEKTFKQLSAVITNEKIGSCGYDRFWYMLPALKDRHTPNLCISRVCGESPETIYVAQAREKQIVVDANFITLWNVDEKAHLKALALLHSTWAKIFLEIIGSTMGGGALKIDACHVRKIIFPKITAENEKKLEEIGRCIIKNKIFLKKNQEQIDIIVTSSFGKKNGLIINKQLKEILANKIQNRIGRK